MEEVEDPRVGVSARRAADIGLAGKAWRELAPMVGHRPAARRAGRSNHLRLPDILVSTIRFAPVTVTVSSSAPTRISAFTVNVINILPLDGVEGRQTEGDDICAKPQINDLV